MKTLLQTRLKILSLFIALIITGTLCAQERSYAVAVKRNTPAHDISTRVVIIDPVVKIRARSDKKVTLSWAPYRGEVSHYVLERSTDGRSFTEVGLLFTGDSSNEPVYSYDDKFKSAYKGPLFYRLRVVGLDESEIYTPLTVINAAQ